MTKGIYKRNHTWGLHYKSVSHNHHDGEHVRRLLKLGARKREKDRGIDTGRRDNERDRDTERGRKAETQREKETELVLNHYLKIIVTFKTSKLVSTDTIPPTKPHILILPKQFHLLGSKYQSI